MHERAVTQSIIDIVVDKMKAEKVTRVDSITLVIGMMHDYETHWIEHYYNELSAGTPAHGAVIKIEKVPISFKCRECGKNFTLDVFKDREMVCKHCKSEKYDMVTGREFYIKEMEIDDEDNENVEEE
ncbi:MAG: hydrogenase maturation nickel metallochaperone HypA [Lachnospiraceae bacterium]|nr:hydrogenase maturation nickel metallochaperone HypA [Lachnospiraceae bacterium]